MGMRCCGQHRGIGEPLDGLHAQAAEEAAYAVDWDDAVSIA